MKKTEHGKRLYIREEGKKTCSTGWAYDGDPIGWFSNKHNSAEGWAIYALEPFEVEWLHDNEVSVNNVYRIASMKGTTIVKFNFGSGVVAFMDGSYHVETDKIKFHKAAAYRKVIFDDYMYMDC